MIKCIGLEHKNGTKLWGLDCYAQTAYCHTRGWASRPKLSKARRIDVLFLFIVYTYLALGLVLYACTASHSLPPTLSLYHCCCIPKSSPWKLWILLALVGFLILRLPKAPMRKREFALYDISTRETKYQSQFHPHRKSQSWERWKRQNWATRNSQW